MMKPEVSILSPDSEIIRVPQNVIKKIKNSISEATSRMECIKEPIGCGRFIEQTEFLSWDALTRNEYSLSGWCSTCQDKIFVEPED
jgi:hypothetical protein